jgi:hypothetical protein
MNQQSSNPENQESLYSELREDIEVVLKQIEQEEQIVQASIRRAKLNYERQMTSLQGDIKKIKLGNEQKAIKMLMEEGARKLVLPLIDEIDRCKAYQSDQSQRYQYICNRIRLENKSLRIKMSAIRYELSRGEEVSRDRILEILNTETTIDMFQDLLEILSKAMDIAYRYREQGKLANKSQLRTINRLVVAFEEKYRTFNVGEEMHNDPNGHWWWLLINARSSD